MSYIVKTRWSGTTDCAWPWDGQVKNNHRGPFIFALICLVLVTLILFAQSAAAQTTWIQPPGRARIYLSNVRGIIVPAQSQTSPLVTNGSFEVNPPNGSYNYGAPTGWKCIGPSYGMQNPTPSQLSSGVDGKTVLWVNTGTTCSQDVGPTASGVNYSLTVSIGSQGGFTGAYTLSYAGCTVSGSTTSGSLVPVTLPCAASGEIVISLTTTSGQVIFDNVTLTTTSAVPLQSKNFSFSGQLLWDDTTPIQGTLQVQQYDNIQKVWNNIGTLTPDAQGNISSTVTLMTTFADIVQFNFTLLDANGNTVGFLQPAAPGALFLGISSVTGFHLIIQKSGCGGKNACVIAAGTVFGTIQ